MKKKIYRKKDHGYKEGDRVWLRIPHNGTIEHIYGNGDIRVVLDEIPAETSMERFGKEEFSVL